MNLTWPPKLVSENLNYTLDWTDALDGKTIILSEWSVVSTSNAIVIGAETNSSTATEVWLSGGTPGTAVIRNRITTNNGLIFVEDVKLLIRA